MQTKFENTDDFLSSDEYREYILGRSTNKDKKWDAYFKNNPEMKVYARKAQKIIIGLSSMRDSTADSEVSELQMQHNFERAWKKYKDSQSNNLVQNASGLLRRGLAVAAAIIFAVVIYSLLNKFIINTTDKAVFSEIYVPPAKQSQLTLPDGSVVWLNADSRLKYSNQFNSKNRDVYLQGEAYFEVENNSKVPFKVISDRAVVKVTGTKFNVRAYPDEDRIEAVLAEGKVVLNTKSGLTEKSYELNPGDKAVYDLTCNRVSFISTDVKRELVWKEGKLAFVNTPLAEVCKSFQRWYNVEISIHGDSLSIHPFTFTVEGETIEQILEYLTRAAPLEYKMAESGNLQKNKSRKIHYIISPVK